MPNSNLTLITVVLDRSGSMTTVREATIAGLNQFLAGQKQLSGEAKLHFVQFDDKYEIHKDMVDLETVPELTQADFMPRGSTALLDAIGRTITELGLRLASTPEAQRPSKVVFVIQTDGFENASTDYNYDKIQQMITHQRDKYSWDFVFLGANQDAIATGAKLGVGGLSSLSYNANPGSTLKSFQVVSRAVASSRMAGAGGSSTFGASARSYVSDDNVKLDASLDSTVDITAPVDPNSKT